MSTMCIINKAIAKQIDIKSFENLNELFLT